jgi:DNA repair protein RecN (Recombination protein N)
MLQDLHIRNVAIIDQLQLELGKGLNLLTGETGAGKSIIIDALGLALGNRMSADLISAGADEAFAEATFTDISEASLEKLFLDIGIEFDGQLVLRRRVTRAGASKAYINDSQVNLKTMQKVGDLLMAIHGQGEGDELLSHDGQMRLLDSYASAGDLVQSVTGCFATIRSIEKELSSVEIDNRARERAIDLLQHQINEIEMSQINSSEEEKLTRESSLLMNAEKISTAGQKAYSLIYEADDAITSRLSEAAHCLDDIAEFDEGIAQIGKSVAGLGFQLEDTATEIRNFLEQSEADPEKLAQIEERLDLYRELKRKYGSSVEEVLEYLAKSHVELLALQNAEERQDQLEKELQTAFDAYDLLSDKLSNLRHEKARLFADDIENQLKGLAMERARVSVEVLTNHENRGRSGIDKVSFLIAANPGSELKPLKKVASGGEQSRIILAIKSSVPGLQDKGTIIFDEVDTGIGGRVAEFVGRKLTDLSAKQQIICITHLPQIAIYSDKHLSISKDSTGENVTVNISSLDEEEKIEEIARMIGGEEISAATRANAAEMIEQAQKHK